MEWKGWGVLAVLLAGLGLDGPAVRPAHAREPATGEVVGQVVDGLTRGPIAQAFVEVVGSKRVATTDEEGRFRLTSLPPGVVSLRFSAFGFRPFIQADVVVSTGKPVLVRVALAPAPLELEGLSVQPGYFVDVRQAPTPPQDLNAEEIRRLPGGQEDVVRAVSLLPGVAPTSVARNDLVVRGGAPFENLFVVDDLEVPNINHFAVLGSSGGMASLVNIDFVRRAEFAAGGLGAPYGDRVGSVTSLSLREGISERHAGEANFAITGFGLMAEGPLGRGSYLVGMRRSYFDLILEMVGEVFFLRYWDVNAKVVQRLGRRDELSWTFVGAIDEWGFNIDTAEDLHDAALMATNDDQYFTALTWRRSYERSLLQVTAGRIAHAYDISQDDTLGAAVFANRADEVQNSLRVGYTRTLTPAATVEVGAAVRREDPLRYDVELSGFLRPDSAGKPQPLDLDTAFAALRLASYGQTTVQWTPRLSTTLGGRADYYEHLGKAVRWSPRGSAAIDAGGGLTLTLSAGRYWQSPNSIWLVGDPGNGERLEPFRVDQGIVGAHKLLREDLKIQVEVYYKRYAGYPARLWRPQAVVAADAGNVQADVPFALEPLGAAGRGRAYGAEGFLQKRLSQVPVYGIASLSFNRTEFKALDHVWRTGAYDAPVIGNLAVGWRPNPSWDLGVKFRIARGLPTTPYLRSGPQEGRLDYDRYNDRRMPTLHALDLRIDRRWIFQRLQLTTYLDIQDVYNRNYPLFYGWDDRERTPYYEEAVGFLPSLGLNVEF
jgi:hypothetical protein